MKKTAVITGASRGIGHALSRKLLSMNYHVIGTSRQGTIDSISHENFESLPLNLPEVESMKQFVDTIASKNSKVDLLINNAGIGPDLNYELPEKGSFDITFDVNVKGQVLFTEMMLPMMKAGGRILNVSSKMGSIDYLEMSCSPSYRMSKSALNMYTKILANRLKGRIEVAAIHPGWVKTTISGNGESGRLTPEESAESISDYLETKFENGGFWDAERNVKLVW